MNVKKVTIILITLFFILLTIFFLFFIQVKEMEKTQNDIANELILKLSIEIKQGNIKDSTISTLPDKLFYAVWIKKSDENWKPIIYDITKLSKMSLTNPSNIPKRISSSARVLTKKTNNFQFVIWINKYNIEYIFKYIILTFLFILLIYLFIILIIEVLYKDKVSGRYEKAILIEDEDIAESNNIQDEKDILNYYKELWTKNFNISDDFKNNFPFKEIFNLISISTKTNEYIEKSINFASNYFNWESPKLFINQGNRFIDVNTKDTIKPNNQNIPKDGKQKGEILIPLFPYNFSIIYGYFYFKWNNENDFYISDLLYFLKFLFSEKAEFLFKNYENVEILHNKLDTLFKYNSDNVLFGIIEADNKNKIEKELDKKQIEKVKDQISINFKKSFNDLEILKVSQLTFAIIGTKFEKNSIVKDIEKWIKDTNNQYYQISKEYGDIALTFSCGISFRDTRDIHLKTLIIESEINFLLFC